MAPRIENLPKIAKDVESFYKSSKQTMTLNITLSPPINQTFALTINKFATYQDTLNNVISRIKLQLSGYSRVTLRNTNGNEQTMFFSNGQDRYNFINLYRNQEFHKYLTQNSCTGKLVVTNKL